MGFFSFFLFLSELILNVDNNSTGTGMVIPFWDFYGATMVTNAFVRLTPDQQSKIGGLFNAIVSVWQLLILIQTFLLFTFQIIFKIHLVNFK